MIKDWQLGKFHCGFESAWREWIFGFHVQVSGRFFSPYAELNLGPLHLYALWDKTAT